MDVPPLTHNLLLAAMPEASRGRLEAAGRISDLQIAQRLFEEHEVTSVYFPLDGVLSLLRDLSTGESVEIGMVGPEGFTGINGVLGMRRNVYSCVVQGRGAVLTVPQEAVREEMQRDAAMAALLQKFIMIFLGETSQLVVCNRVHRIEQRLAHWLLMLHDRTGSDEMAVTHEFLSYMLATRRASITEAMNALSEAGAIEPRRSRARVVDRAKLESLACECYMTNFAEYEAALGFKPVAKSRVLPID